MSDDFELGDDFDNSGTGSRSNAQKIFDTRVTKKIKQLSSKNPAARRDAAYWLGESGEPKAITSLVKIYKKDKDKTVREAAGYALSMFRALQQALEGSEEEQNQALGLIEKIVNEGKLGKRSRLRPALVVRIEIGLAGLLVVILLLGVIRLALKGGGGGGEVPTETRVAVASPNTMAMVDDMRQRYQNIRSDAAALQQQFLNLQTGKAINCQTTLSKKADPYVLPADIGAAYPAIKSAADQLTQAQASLTDIRTIFENACRAGAPALTAADVVQPMQKSIDLLKTNLPALDAALTAAAAVATITPTVPVATAGPPTATPTPPPTNTAAPTATPTPLPVEEINRTLTALEFSLDQVTRTDGAATLLNQYWRDVTTGGKTDGCLSPLPNIPSNAQQITDENLKRDLPELVEAIDSVNLGLAQVRQSATIFQNACTSNDLLNQATAGASFIKNASAAFENARNAIAAVRKKLRR